MIINTENLISGLNIKDPDEQSQYFIQMILEAIAQETDNVIMNDLMLEMIKRNALLNAELEHKLEEIRLLSVTDQLTGLYNRRKFLDMLHNEIKRVQRYNRPFAIIMLDIDHFKSVNDTYGHDVGDFVLRELSHIVRNTLRSSDTFARWGGEEFMILLPEITAEGASILAEKLRGIIETHDFSPVRQLTSSFGVVNCTDESHCDVQYLTKSVDEALYQSKETGRNKVTVVSNSVEK